LEKSFYNAAELRSWSKFTGNRLRCLSSRRATRFSCVEKQINHEGH